MTTLEVFLIIALFAIGIAKYLWTERCRICQRALTQTEKKNFLDCFECMKQCREGTLPHR